MNHRHIALIATTLLGLALATGCTTSNHNFMSNRSNDASTQKSVPLQPSEGSAAKSSSHTAPSKSINTITHALNTQPDTYIATPEWVTSQLVYVVGWNKRTNPINTLFVSRNAGESWTKIATPLGNHIFQVHFESPTTGMVSGSSKDNSLIMYRTTDGGAAWTKEAYPSRITQGAVKYGDPQVTFVTLNHKLTWLMATWNDNQFARHALYHSNDNGVTWTFANNNQSLAAQGYVSSFYAPDSETAYFVSFCSKCEIPGDPNMTGTNTLFITRDAGRTWRKTALPFTGENRVVKLIFTDHEHGTATIENSMNSQIRTYVTSDGGRDW